MNAATYRERLTLARRTHVFSWAMTTACLIPTLISAVFVASGQYPASAIASAASVLPMIHCLQLVRDSNDRLDKLLAETHES
jgi:hypothetical protein